MTITQILQKIRSAFYTKAETDTKLNGKSGTSHNHNSTYLGIKAKAESAKSADSVAWANVSGKPTIPSNTNQLTNGAGFITSSGSCNYANSAGSATNATNATQASFSNQLQAFTGDDFTGGNHFVKAIRSTSGWSTRLWMCYNGGAKTSNEISVAYADSAGIADYASRSTNNGAFYISGYKIYVG